MTSRLSVGKGYCDFHRLPAWTDNVKAIHGTNHYYESTRVSVLLLSFLKNVSLGLVKYQTSLAHFWVSNSTFTV